MKPLDYLHLQMRLEGKEVENGCWLRQVAALPGEDMPLLLVVQLAGGEQVGYYDERMTPDLHGKLSTRVPEITFPAVDPLLQVLMSRQVLFQLGHYKTYVFPFLPTENAGVLCLLKHDPSLRALDFDGFAEHVYAIQSHGVVVSACVSARENEQCGETWVYTRPEYRRQGLAQKVVRAWARSLMEAGKVPFYSHKIENTASARLAAKLGLQPVFEEIAITQV